MNRSFLVATLFATLAPVCAQTPLPRDPANVYGTFDNGLDYIVRQTANPPGKFSAFLHIKAGALHETEPQNGIAHFLEHMAFNGSKNYPPGELIPALNELGMSFGADSNAHTALDETVYKLHLPENSAEMVERALTILSDIASGLLLTKEEIEDERSVILEEKTAGKGLQRAHRRSRARAVVLRVADRRARRDRDRRVHPRLPARSVRRLLEHLVPTRPDDVDRRR